MSHSNNLVKNIQKDHDESLNLIRQFRKALSSCKEKEAKEIFDRLGKRLTRHLNFELDYLYPRMRRLLSETTERLYERQKKMAASIEKSQRMLKRCKIDKNRLAGITKTLDMISDHLADCVGIASLANGFCKEEKTELGQRFKEYCVTVGSKPKERRVRR